MKASGRTFEAEVFSLKLPMPASMRHSLIGSVLTCCGMALAVPLLDWTFNPHVTVRHLVTQYLYSLVYSNCIGNLQFGVVPRVWIWSERFSAVTRWFTRVTTVVAATTAGCLMANALLMAMVRGDYDFWGEFIGSFKIAIILSAAAVSFIATFETYKYRLQATAMELKSKELER